MAGLAAEVSSLPGWMLAVIVIVAGWLVARIGRIVVARLLALLHFNQLCERTGTGDFLRKGEVPFSAAELVGCGAYWVILIGTLLEAARLLDLAVADEFRLRILAGFPALLSAVLVLAVGLLLVSFLAGFVRTVTRNAGSPYANLWSRFTRGVGVLLVLAIAFEQAELRGSILAGAVQIAIAAIAFGMALAFGLGCKDMARGAMEKWIAELKERHRESAKPDMEG